MFGLEPVVEQPEDPGQSHKDGGSSVSQTCAAQQPSRRRRLADAQAPPPHAAPPPVLPEQRAADQGERQSQISTPACVGCRVGSACMHAPPGWCMVYQNATVGADVRHPLCAGFPGAGLPVRHGLAAVHAAQHDGGARLPAVLGGPSAGRAPEHRDRHHDRHAAAEPQAAQQRKGEARWLVEIQRTTTFVVVLTICTCCLLLKAD